jgi:hypothetical protein
MKYIPLIFTILGYICSIVLAAHCYFMHQSSEATAWGVGSIWATNCLIHEIRDFRNGANNSK